MSTNTFSRSLHDVGLAAWFGGTLANAVALNAAAGEAADQASTGRVANAGWDRWTPVNAAAIATVSKVFLMASTPRSRRASFCRRKRPSRPCAPGSFALRAISGSTFAASIAATGRMACRRSWPAIRRPIPNSACFAASARAASVANWHSFPMYSASAYV